MPLHFFFARSTAGLQLKKETKEKEREKTRKKLSKGKKVDNFALVFKQ